MGSWGHLSLSRVAELGLGSLRCLESAFLPHVPGPVELCLYQSPILEKLPLVSQCDFLGGWRHTGVGPQGGSWGCQVLRQSPEQLAGSSTAPS